MQYLAKMKKRNYFYAAFTIRKAREEAVGDRLIALVYMFQGVLAHYVFRVEPSFGGGTAFNFHGGGGGTRFFR